MLTAPVPLLGPAWRSLGPTEIPGGQTYGASRVTVAGRVAAIAIDPSTRNDVLVGAAAGGCGNQVTAAPPRPIREFDSFRQGIRQYLRILQNEPNGEKCFQELNSDQACRKLHSALHRQDKQIRR